MKREVKVGIFIAIGLMIMATFIFIVGDLSSLFKRPGYKLFLYFDSAAGLEKRTGVRLAGVKIGYVEDIQLKGSQAEILLNIDPEVKLRTDSKATLAALGLLGEKYIEILPGRTGEYADEGSTIEVIPPVSIDQLGTELAAVGAEIRETGKLFREMLGSDESRSNLSSILSNLADFSADLKEFSASNKQSLSHSVENASSAISNFDERVVEVSQNLDELVMLLKDLVEENRENVKGNLENIKELLGKLEKSLGLLDETLNKINAGEGTLGRLIQRTELYDQAEETMGEIRQAVQPVSAFRATAGLRFEYYANPDLVKGYLSMSFWPAKDTFVLGGVIQDPFLDRITYSLQGGLRWRELQARAGFFQSKLGAAVDAYALKDRLRITLEGFDLNRERYPYFRLYSRFSPTRYIYLLFGLDDFAFKDNRKLFFGLGFGL